MALIAREDAACLAALAGAAERNLTIGPALPPGWSVFETLPIEAPALGPATRGAQGFIATGALPSDPGTNVTVLAMALPFISYAAQSSYQPTQRNTGLAPVPQGILAQAGNALAPAVAGYADLRDLLWATFGRTVPRPLWITGAHLGATLAALAAIDLRPGNVGPDGTTKGPKSPANLAMFSAPAQGDPSFGAAVAAHTGTARTFWSDHLGRAVDDFPGPPVATAVTAGTASPVTARSRAAAPGLITGGDTWIDRDSDSYVMALGGDPTQLGIVPAALSAADGAVDVLSVAAMADLVGLPYLLARQPGMPLPAPLNPYALRGDIEDGETIWGAHVSAPGRTAILFRDSIGWVEYADITCNYDPTPVPYSGPQWANAASHGGAVTLYAALKPGIDAAVTAALTADPGQILHFAGHGVGAVVGLLAALDALIVRKPQVQPRVWMFGAPQYATYDFFQQADPLIGSTTLAVNRRSDFLPRIPLAQQYFPIGTTVSLMGRPAVDDPTAHGLSAYAALLSPRDLTGAEIAR